MPMPYESGLISYAAFASLALATKKHGSGMTWSGLPSRRALRVLGWTLLAFSAVVAVAQLGPALGVTAWIGQMSLAGPFLVLLLSWRPRLAMILAGASMICALLVAIL
jgi:hypothetical protein